MKKTTTKFQPVSPGQTQLKSGKGTARYAGDAQRMQVPHENGTLSAIGSTGCSMGTARY